MIIIERGLELMEDNNSSNDKIKSLEVEVDGLLAQLRTTICKSKTNRSVQIQRMEEGIKTLKWSVKKYKLRFNGEPEVVKKNEIFYCNLGFNIGSEQGDSISGDKRPVLILQNDKGNSSSKTTIIAPITTHQEAIKEKKIIRDGNEVIIYTVKQIVKGIEKEKTLGYYEVPVRLEPEYSKEVIGVINLAQIRTISKKRLEKKPVAKINDKTVKEINNAMKRLLNMED